MVYQGFGSGTLDGDAVGVRQFAKDKNNIIISYSYAKNMGLYGEKKCIITKAFVGGGGNAEGFCGRWGDAESFLGGGEMQKLDEIPCCHCMCSNEEEACLSQRHYLICELLSAHFTIRDLL